MSLPENFESQWSEAAPGESLQELVQNLKSYISEHWADAPENVEAVLYGLLERSNGAANVHILTATLALSPLDLRNKKLIERIVHSLNDPSSEVRLAAVNVVGRMASECRETAGTFLSQLLKKLESEWDNRCRDRLLVHAETSIGNAQAKLAKLCLGETADKERGPWREMFTLASLQETNLSVRDWSSFLDELLPSMEAWNNLTWNAFCEFAKSANRQTSLFRKLIERIPELIRIAEVVEKKHTFTTNCRTRHVLTGMMRPLNRRRKKELLSQHIAFFVDAIKYNDRGLSSNCLELFAELSIVPPLSSEQRELLLNDKDDLVRELAEELFAGTTTS